MSRAACIKGPGISKAHSRRTHLTLDDAVCARAPCQSASRRNIVKQTHNADKLAVNAGIGRVDPCTHPSLTISILFETPFSPFNHFSHPPSPFSRSTLSLARALSSPSSLRKSAALSFFGSPNISWLQLVLNVGLSVHPSVPSVHTPVRPSARGCRSRSSFVRCLGSFVSLSFIKKR